ncbi:MAG: methyltransferase domain-containing protein [Anaerolineales bacterium]
MPLPLQLAHRRYVQQAGWTEPMRRHLLRRAGLPNARRVLEIGCGSGAVLRSIVRGPRAELFGVDIDRGALQLALQQASEARLAAGDAHQLPYKEQAFDICFFHFVLLWLKEPAAALQEARRVTRLGGSVLALAEPDYSQRVDRPASLAQLGRLQTEALRNQGAQPEIGGQLAKLFGAASLDLVETGQLEPIAGPATSRDADLEWQVLRADLEDRVSEAELDRLAAEDLRARQGGERTLSVPTFYVWAKVSNGKGN